MHGKRTATYLCYVAVRLFEIRRVLKDTGQPVSALRPHGGAYLRQLLDGI